MEDPMCWEMDYHWFAEQQKAQEKEREKKREKQKQAQRAEAIDQLLTEANKGADTAGDRPAAKESVAVK
jgi:hypothetical protein